MSPKKAEGQRSVVDISQELKALEGKVRLSETKETYMQVASGPDHRIGVIATVLPDGSIRYSIEFLLCILGPKCMVDVRLLEEALRITKELKSRGYQPVHQDDGWICCERALARDEVSSECEALAGIVKGFDVGSSKEAHTLRT